ncbi:hypothetical protein AB0D04_07370 [Streptomyces sp. NPDC048483]|uniref:hypothetical protein n=1 Tax=Streptomyces sp. NPDC048483 TaxID=3154927 RepID=UPI003420B4F1
MNATPEQDPVTSALDEMSAARERLDQRAPAEIPDADVLACARALAADPGGERAHEEVYRLLSMTRYVATGADDEVAREVVAALRAAAEAVDGPPCEHATHPYERALDTEIDEVRLAAAVPESVHLEDSEEYRCPHTVAMFARIAAEIIEPGTAEGIPDRVPAYLEGCAKDFEMLLHGYPNSSDPQYDLTTGVPEHPTKGTLAGHIVLIRRSCWDVASGFIRQRWVFDDTIEALERVLARLDGASCAHAEGEHPELSGDEAADAALGHYLLTPGGRARLQKEYEDGGQDAPPAAWTCPVLLRDLARYTHGPLTEARERFFGERRTDHLDAEYLRADGKLEVAKIAERLVKTSRNQPYAEDLAVWAARRRAQNTGDTRERLFLLLAAARCLDIAYPDPPPSVYRPIRPLLEEAFAAPPSETCPHGDDHPGIGADLRDAVGDHLAHLCAPEAFPAPEGALPFDAWACPRNLAPVAQGQLEWMDEWDEAAEDEVDGDDDEEE